MEDFVWRFPLIGRNIFNKLDNQDLTKSKEISKFLCDFLENDRLIWDAAYKAEYDGLVDIDTWEVISEEEFQLNDD